MNLYCLLLLIAMQLTQVGETSAKVSAVIVFGDSSVDAGNNNYFPTFVRSNFEPYGRDFFDQKPTGRYCNGRLPTDFISEAFGLPPTIPAYLDPSLSIENFTKGVCFASAGTGFDPLTSDIQSVMPLWKELEYFKEYRGRLLTHLGEKGEEILREALYVISLGTNDFLVNYYGVPGRSSEFSIGEYEAFIVGIAERFVRDIYDMGARKLDFSGTLPMGCLPVERFMNTKGNHSCIAEFSGTGKEFNRKLRDLVVRLHDELPGLKVVLADVFDLYVDIFAHPWSYGFENTQIGCCGTGLFETGVLCNKNSPFTCKDASKFVFWDSIHPTDTMNSILADYIMETSLHVFQ